MTHLIPVMKQAFALHNLSQFHKGASGLLFL
jgi:hypothetical protein